MASLGERGPESLRPAFARFADDYRATGSFGRCLDRLADELADPVADRLVEALRLTREVGGTDLGRLLRTLSQFLRDDARTRAELEARQSWTVNGARLALARTVDGAAPARAARHRGAGLRPARPASRSSPSAAGCRSPPTLVMRRVGRLPEERRVLRPASMPTGPSWSRAMSPAATGALLGLVGGSALVYTIARTPLLRRQRARRPHRPLPAGAPAPASTAAHAPPTGGPAPRARSAARSTMPPRRLDRFLGGREALHRRLERAGGRRGR